MKTERSEEKNYCPWIYSLFSFVDWEKLHTPDLRAADRELTGLGIHILWRGGWSAGIAVLLHQYGNLSWHPLPMTPHMIVLFQKKNPTASSCSKKVSFHLTDFSANNDMEMPPPRILSSPPHGWHPLPQCMTAMKYLAVVAKSPVRPFEGQAGLHVSYDHCTDVWFCGQGCPLLSFWKLPVIRSWRGK